MLLGYGFFYGPGTWYVTDGGYADLDIQQKFPMIGNGEAVWSWIHIDDAAGATVAALEAPIGTYNVVATTHLLSASGCLLLPLQSELHSLQQSRRSMRCRGLERMLCSADQADGDRQRKGKTRVRFSPAASRMAFAVRSKQHIGERWRVHMPILRLAEQIEEVKACFDLIRLLRPHLQHPHDFVSRWQRQRT
jgi:hypothetical protein